MKKILSIILLVFSSYLLKAQTYPIPQNLGGPTTLVQNPNYGGFKGGLIPYTFADTTAANTALTYGKNYGGILIYTTSPPAMWYRYIAANQWIQILPSGGGTGASGWTLGGNILIPRSDSAVLGSYDNEDWYLISNNQKFLKLNKGGIQANSGSVVNLGVNMSTGDLSFGSSGSGTVTSVGLSVPSVGSPFLGVSGTPVTTSGTLALSALGNTTQYVRGDGSLATYGTATSMVINGLANASNSGAVDLGAFRQIWLPSGVGNVLGSLSITSVSGTLVNDHRNLQIGSTGSFAASGITTYGIFTSIGGTGTSKTNIGNYSEALNGTDNYAFRAQASGGTNNYSFYSVVGDIGMGGSSSGVITIKTQAAAGTFNFNLPTTAGTSGYFLTSGGGGSTAMTWTQNNFLTGLTVGTTTIASGTIGGVIFQGAGNVVQQDATNLFWDDTNNRLGVGTNTPANTFDALSSGTAGRFKSSGYSSSTLIIEDPDGTTYITNGQFKVNTVPFVLNANASYITFQTSGVEKLRIDNTGNIIFGGAATAPDFRFLEGSGGGTNYVGFKANATLAGNTIYTLPTAFPAGTYLLNSTSAGVMGFTDPSTLTGLPYIAITGTSNLTGATTVEMGGQNFTVSDGSTTANIVLSPNAGQIELTLDGTAKTFTAIASSGYFFNTGTVQMNAYGAGAATFDASGNITSVSDERLKNIQGDYEVGLKQVMKINPIVYKWKPESHLETEHSYIGFSAQNILYSLGENAIGRNKDGYLSIQDRGILAALVNSVKELNEKVIEQQKEINKLKKNK